MSERDFNNLVRGLQEERQQIQKKTITKWFNSYLEKEHTRVNDIFIDLADGKLLLKLLEIISGEKLGKPEHGRTRVHYIENVNKCLTFLHTKVRLESIGAEDIVDGNKRLILGLLWTIFLRFELLNIEINIVHENSEKISNAEESLQSTTPSNLDVKLIPSNSWSGDLSSHGHWSTVNSITDSFRGQQLISENKRAKDALLLWCQRKTVGYPYVNILNFTQSWRSGMAFSALIHAHRPDIIDYINLNPHNHIETLNNAFETTQRELEVSKLLDAEDIDTENPDGMSIMTYVSSFY